MTLHRVRSVGATCPKPLNIHTGAIDGAVVYSPAIIFEKKLRKLPGCHLREGDQPGFLPLTTRADSEGRFFIVAGDGRVDEHAALTAMHTVRPCSHCTARAIAASSVHGQHYSGPPCYADDLGSSPPACHIRNSVHACICSPASRGLCVAVAPAKMYNKQNMC